MAAMPWTLPIKAPTNAATVFEKRTAWEDPRWSPNDGSGATTKLALASSAESGHPPPSDPDSVPNDPPQSLAHLELTFI